MYKRQAHRILKKIASVFNQVKNVTEQSLVQQQYEVHTDVRVAIDALDNKCNDDA